MNTMKTKKALVLLTLIPVFFLACDIPMALGNKLDIDGPVVDITSPEPRKAVPAQFTLEGIVTDYSGVKRLLVTTSSNNNAFPKQWQYNNGKWEISEDYGVSWSPYSEADWEGDSKSGIFWSVDIDLTKPDGESEDGEYVFSVQAWDTGNFSDDNSFKTRVLIFDKYPPKVSIINPYIYERFDLEAADTDLYKLHNLTVDAEDHNDARFDPANIGKFITNEFKMQWQIEDEHDVWSIDLLFYPHDADIDGIPETEIPDNYIYRYYENLPPPPVVPAPDLNVKPNGSVTVPALTSAAGDYNGGELKNPVNKKTTVKVVAVCYDAAGHANQEKVLGYFIYWPKADEPWIIYTDGMYPLDDYGTLSIPSLNDDTFTLGGRDVKTFMIYPGRDIKATAFHAQGVLRVEYSLYKFNETARDDGDPESPYLVTPPVLLSDFTNVIIENEPRPNGTFSSIFPWEFRPPNRSGFYEVRARAFSYGNECEEQIVFFRIQDITFPDFPELPSPPASEPLFMHIPNNKLTISGVVSDATFIESLCLVWINPVSRNYSAMSQLQYFRDPDYIGWTQAMELEPTSALSTTEDYDFAYEGTYDSSRPNIVWRLEVTGQREDIDTRRQVFDFSKEIDIFDELGIGKDKELKSQIFLLRVQNPDKKTTIITYAPQGDTRAPEIKITNVTVSTMVEPLEPGKFSLIPKFEPKDEHGTLNEYTVVINGTWYEDSAEYLDIETNLKPYMKFSLNQRELTGSGDNTAIEINQDSPTSTTGTFKVTVNIRDDDTGYAIRTSYLKDTITVSAQVRDIGGNPAEAGGSWLVESDNLRFLRISSDKEDQAWNAGEEIDIFLEFSKPVQLIDWNEADLASNPLQLTLNTTPAGIATYKAGQNNESPRQYFTYTVVQGQNTPTTGDEFGRFLDVTSLTGDTNRFGWRHTPSRGEPEEVHLRMTDESANNGLGVYYQELPVGTGNNQSLITGKNIIIDTAAPVMRSITGSPIGWHTATATEGAEIDITVSFNKPVKLGATEPQLDLNIAGKSTAGTPRVNGNNITFSYKVEPGDNSSGVLQITGFTGDITDIPGTGLFGGIDGVVAGVYVDTTAPAVPVVRISAGSGALNMTNNISSPVTSGTSAQNIGTVYLSAIDLQIDYSGVISSDYLDLWRLEYSTNNGTDWKLYNDGQGSAGNIIHWDSNAPNGDYTIVARQIDRAGNTSPVSLSQPITFNWDKGSLVTRINSPKPTGTYTNTTLNNGTGPGIVNRADIIEIQVDLRRPVTFGTQPSIVLNTGATVPMDAWSASTPVQQLIFKYAIGTNDNTPVSGEAGTTPTGDQRRLYVTDFSGITTVKTSDGTDVAGLMTTPAGANLNDLKELYVKTSALTRTAAPAFDADPAVSATDGTVTSSTLRVTFSDEIVKGQGSITIIQSPTDYRLPAVLTETQYNRYRNITGFNNSYKRATNGVDTGGNTDTSGKYILDYDIDTANSVGHALATPFRNAESIILEVTSQSVTIAENTLIINLSGSNTLQVPGADYLISYPKGFVRDTLGNYGPEASEVSAALGGVAKPFIRINKKQDTITTPNGNGSATAPRLVATQPFTADFRIDSRTPGATISYGFSEWNATTTAINWGTGVGNGGANGGANAAPNGWGVPQDSGAGQLNPATNPVRPNTNIGQAENPRTIGDNNYQGYQCWIRARASKGGANSFDSDERAYRTVITYVANMGNPGNGEQRFGDGDQLWIRGGDEVGSSTIPGFPLTWKDDFYALQAEGKRAGNRLMTKTGNAGDNLYNTTWKWVTWDINVTAYVDFNLGHDNDPGGSSANYAWQYGPAQWAFQRAGWTAFKDKYPIYPGKHRWVNSGLDAVNGRTNFTTIFYSRSAGLTVTAPNANTNP